MFVLFPEGVTDPEINKLARFRASKTGKSGKNAARDFHRFLERDGKLFNVKVSTPQIPVRRKVRLARHGRRFSKERLEPYPCIYMSSWMKGILQECPKFVLGGHDPSSVKGLKETEAMLLQFWQNFRSVQGDHPIYQRSPGEQARTIPIAYHGDEGRGLGKEPVLILSCQLVIPYTGPTCLNSTKPLAI